MTEPVFVLGGYQTDFARNWTKENKHISAMFNEVVQGGTAAAAMGADLSAGRVSCVGRSSIASPGSRASRARPWVALSGLRSTRMEKELSDALDDLILGRGVARGRHSLTHQGRPVRAEFEERLREYYKKTAPLTGYYYAKGRLKTVDGMASIDAVTAEIEKVLAASAK